MKLLLPWRRSRVAALGVAALLTYSVSAAAIIPTCFGFGFGVSPRDPSASEIVELFVLSSPVPPVPDYTSGRSSLVRVERSSNTFVVTVLLTHHPEQFADWTPGARFFVGPLATGRYNFEATIYVDSLETEWHPPTCPPPEYPLRADISVSASGPDYSKASVIEFYNAELDHYFITQLEPEIALLDQGIIRGWTRTGHSFPAYKQRSATGVAVGSDHAYQVCRLYGLPSAGLDTHFYSSDITECSTVLSTYAGKWIKEDAAAFAVPKFNRITGECPPDTDPVYRLWNARVDSNHRYTTSPAIRDSMIASGYVSEGYGPLGVAMCAPR